jgi:hypothetical protein
MSIIIKNIKSFVRWNYFIGIIIIYKIINIYIISYKYEKMCKINIEIEIKC